jgi:hypothetical protein
VKESRASLTTNENKLLTRDNRKAREKGEAIPQNKIREAVFSG